MANTLRFKRGLASGIPTALAGEPLFTTDTFDLYIGNGTTNTRFQKYIASGATTQILRGDGSLYTFPLAISSPSSGQVLKYNGTSWVNDSDSGITGSLTTNYLPKATGATTLGNSLVYDNGTNVGIGTTSPDYTLTLQVAGLSTLGLIDNTEATNQKRWVFQYGTPIGAGTFRLRAINDANSDGQNAYIITRSATSVQTHQWLTAGSERARIFATGNFGIGTGATDSGQRLQVVGSGRFSGTGFNSASAAEVQLNNTTATTGRNYGLNSANGGFFQVYDITGGNASRLIIDASGNMGLSVIPSSWSLLTAFDFGNAGSSFLGGSLSVYQNNVYLSSNAYYNSGWKYKNGTNLATNYEQSSGAHQWFTAPSGTAGNAITFTQAMTLTANSRLLLNSTTDTGEQLQVTGTMKVTGASSFGGNITSSLNIISNNGTVDNRLSWSSTPAGVVGTISNHPLEFYTNGGVKMLLNASGNLGLGVTPSAWATFRAMEIGGAALSLLGGSSSVIFGSLGVNWYFDGTNRIYKNTAAATYYNQSNGQHAWFTAPSGTAGNAITFTQAMTLDASGNLLLGTTSSSSVNGSGVFPKAIFYNTTGDNIIAKNATQEVAIGGDYIFANTNNALRFGANNGEGARLTPSRNLHIGTFSADSGEKLQVTGTAKITGASTFGGTMTTSVTSGLISVFDSTNTNGGYIVLRKSNVDNLYIGNRAAVSGDGGTGYDFYTVAGNDMRFFAGATKALTLATTGAATFSSSVTATNLLLDNTSANGSGRIVFNTGGTRFGYIGTSLWTLGEAGTDLTIVSVGGLRFATNDSSPTRMMLTTSGNLLVGSTTDSGEKLQVNGTAKITGNVGIGTASDVLYPLKVERSTAGVGIQVYNSTTYSQIRLQSSGTNQSSYLTFNPTGTGKAVIQVSDTDRLTIDTSGNLAVDTNTLFVDATNNRVGVLTTTPSEPLHVAGNMLISGANSFKMRNLAGTDVNVIRAVSGGTSVLSTATLGNNIAIGTQSAHDFLLCSSDTERIRLSSSGWFSHTTATNPSSSVTDSYVQYSADVTAGNAAPHFRTENGAVIKLYQETTAVGNAIISLGGGNSVLDDTTFDGYTLRQIVKALRNQGILA